MTAEERVFDPLNDNDPSNAEEAVALACAWASGKRSWINYGPHEPHTPDVIATMDAQQVVKYGALAMMFSKLENDAKAFEIFKRGVMEDLS